LYEYSQGHGLQKQDETMKVANIQVRNIRNIRKLELEPASGLSLIWGSNGQGKTNLLESVHLGLTGRSFRTRHDAELLPWKARAGSSVSSPENVSRADILLERRTGSRQFRAVLGDGWKRVFLDGHLLPRLGDLLNEAAVVTFIPEDAGLFKGSPSGRRRFLDSILCQVVPGYLSELHRYRKCARQVNAAIRMAAGRKSPALEREVEAWMPGLAASAAFIMAERSQRLNGIAGRLEKRFRQLGGKGQAGLKYDPDIRGYPADESKTSDMDPKRLLEVCHSCLSGSLMSHGSLRGLQRGIHRDDFSIDLDGLDLGRYGSQGQHRLCALSLKLETAEWIGEMMGESPVLLLDDFGSELDPQRREAVLSGLHGRMQVIVTATDPSDLGHPGMFDLTCHIRNGRIVDC
jgi:DNA replication and repair protein RecF